jgi:hypothetical protein
MDSKIKEPLYMNKFFATLVLVLSSLNMLHAQEGYIKYNTESDYKYRNKAIKCFKSEIVRFIKSTKANKINIIIGKDTITDLTYPSNSFDTIHNPNTSYLTKKEDLVQLKKGGLVIINATSISSSDTVTLISENGTRLTQLITHREDSVKQSDCGKSFRLIITNTPTIYYNSDNLKQFVEHEMALGETVPQEEPNNGLEWWYYMFIGLGMVIMVFGVWRFLQSRKLKPNEVRFYEDNLTEFAKSYGGLNHLSSINPKGLIPTQSEWDKINKKDKAQVIKSLKGKRVIVKEENETSLGFMDSGFQEKKPLKNTNEWKEPKGSFVQQTNRGQNDYITQQIMQVESNILDAIRISSSRGNENLTELNRLNNQFSNLKNENNKLKIDYDKLERDNDSLKIEKNQKDKELEQLQEKVIAVEYLKEYCASVSAYLKLCNEVSSDAYDYFDRISQQNLDQAFIVGNLLMKFQNNVNAFPVGNWMQIAQDIKDTGTTTNKKLIRSFSQIQNEEERKREFKRLLFTEVLLKYSSSILILAETFRNLRRFQVSSELVNDAQNTFAKHVSELISKVKSTGLENKYVPLFKNFEEFLGQTESVDREKSIAYRAVTGLEKGAIVEIVSYGVKTPFEETKTLIILA